MKKYITSLPHHPKRVIIISLVAALVIGAYGYVKINKDGAQPSTIGDSIDTSSTASSGNLTLGFLASGRIQSVLVKAGDTVKKGQVLASLDAENTLGSLKQAQAAYKVAQANYQKIINGATGTAVDVAKAAVNTAQVNLDGTTKQQTLLVTNAHTNLLNSTLTPIVQGSDNSIAPPLITGTYNKDAEGSITFVVNQAGNNAYVTFSGITTGTATVSTSVAQPITDTGLYIEFTSISPYIGTTWVINIPTKTAPNYLANYNAYQSALQTKNQVINSAQAVLDQANASLAALVTAARPEDVAMAQAQMDNASGAVQVAQASYENTIITAPSDGTVLSVAIAPGQIATSGAPAIQFTSVTSSN